MPIEDTPKFLNEQDVQPVDWIKEAIFDLHLANPDILTYKQLQEQKMLAITRTAVEAASSGHVENYAFVNTPDVFAPTPERKPMTPSEQVLRHGSKWMRDWELAA